MISFLQGVIAPICWTEDGFNMSPPEQPTLSEIKAEKEQFYEYIKIESTIEKAVIITCWKSN